MARYADIDDLIINKSHCDRDGSRFVYCDDIEPTADVVEVVRCKDCVHHKNAPKTTDVWCERIDGLLQKDWFCADGERREDE
jgi:hypothetical protein